MRKFWIVLLSLGFVAAFCMPAAAVDLKLGGSYFVQGFYDNNRSLIQPGTEPSSSYGRQSSMAYMAQRLRIEPTLEVAPGLTLKLQFDAMERVWGQALVGAEGIPTGALNTRNLAAEQNIQFRATQLSFAVPVGMVVLGYTIKGAPSYGTEFNDGNDGEGNGSIALVTKLGPTLVSLCTEKSSEGRLGTATFGPGYVDTDNFDLIIVTMTYFPKGRFDLVGAWYKTASARPTSSYQWTFWAVGICGNVNLGPAFLECEFAYHNGEMMQWDPGVAKADVDYITYRLHLRGKVNLGPAYVGAQYGFIPGNDPTTAKYEGMPTSATGTWPLCLILFEDWTNRWSGGLGYYVNSGKGEDAVFDNAKLYQIFAGWNPTPKIALKASYTWAYADQPYTLMGTPYVSDKYGQEFDVTASYKIYNNLEYKVGFGYLWTGDYFKGTNAKNQIDNDYLFMHQLTLSF